MAKEKKVAFYTLGCKLNFTETATLARDFTDNGYVKVGFEDDPDVFVINTCSVTESANKKCRNLVKKAKRIAPEAFVAVTGCYAQLKPKEIAAIPGVNLVLGATEKFNILEHVNHSNKDKKQDTAVHACEIDHVNEFIPSYSQGDRTRSFLKVQDGCDYSCSFCTIPLARGASRSDTIANLVESAEKIGKSGVKEIVLSGVNIGDFGKGTPISLLDLIKALDQVKSVERFRISSIEPNLLTNEIIEFVANSRRFMPHFHIPLQSGSDKILKRMKRRYLRKLYSDRVISIKKMIPHCCIGVDVIVGFPGETSEDFLDTYNFLNELDISYLHVFSYSERENTKAIKMDGIVPKSERAERSKNLHQLSDKKRRSFYKEFERTAAKILFESPKEDGTINGFTENYVKVKANHKKGMEGTLVKRSLGCLDKDSLMLIEPLRAELNASNNFSYNLS